MIVMPTEQDSSIDTTTTPKPYGELWTVAENKQDQGSIEWNTTKDLVQLYLDPIQIQGSIRGNDLYEHFKQKNIRTLNATVWEYLKFNQTGIPENWKIGPKGNAQYVFFWGTLDRSPDGDLYVRYISWTGGNWVFSNYLLGGNWHEDFPAAILP